MYLTLLLFHDCLYCIRLSGKSKHLFKQANQNQMNPNMQVVRSNPRSAQPRRPCTHNVLSLMQFNNQFAFVCDGCREIGYGTRYKCSAGCNYHLHERCHIPIHETYHPFYEQRLFKFHRQHSPNIPGSIGLRNLCESCGEEVKGWMYRTDENASNRGRNIFLHPCCMHLPHRVDDNSGEILILKKRLETIKCHFCDNTTLGGRIKGWAYISNNQALGTHVKCMADMMYKDWKAYCDQQYVITNMNYYNDDHRRAPWVGISDSASSSHAGQSNSQTLQLARPLGQRCRRFWTLAMLAIKVFIHCVSGNLVDAVVAVQGSF